jgi:hypothetical protein
MVRASASIAADEDLDAERAAALERQAQLRTRTGDPFLTMEVLYQLS